MIKNMSIDWIYLHRLERSCFDLKHIWHFAEDPDKDSNKENQVSEEKQEPLPVLSDRELTLYRLKKLGEKKQRIAELSTAVIENPEENVSLDYVISYIFMLWNIFVYK